jgi:hypothetical protein
MIQESTSSLISQMITFTANYTSADYQPFKLLISLIAHLFQSRSMQVDVFSADFLVVLFLVYFRFVFRWWNFLTASLWYPCDWSDWLSRLSHRTNEQPVAGWCHCSIWFTVHGNKDTTLPLGLTFISVGLRDNPLPPLKKFKRRESVK